MCREMAMARVGTAHVNETLALALLMNLRTIVRLERKHGRDADFHMNVPFPPIPRVSVPRKLVMPAA
jgi:hypothetical protein